jgi:RNase P/RNase MRP subunit POP5
MEKTKKLKLKPSLRDNRRYLLISGSNEEEIKKAILEYIGILGMAKCAYMFVKSQGDKLVIGIKRKELEKVKASLILKGIKIERVSGTLKGLER